MTTLSKIRLAIRKIILEQKKEKVVRAGKVVYKMTCPPGKKAVKNNCVQMTAQEKYARKQAGKKASVKRRGQAGASNKKRALSNKRRKAAGL